MTALPDGSSLYETERRIRHVDRPELRVTELQLGPTQEVPWHTHTHAQDTFYVIAGEIRLVLREPEEERRLRPGETFAVRPGRPHRVANGGGGSASFLVLQGVGEIDWVPLP